MSDWEAYELGDLVSFANGGAFPNRHQGFKGNGYDFYKVSDMNKSMNKKYMKEAENKVDDAVIQELKAKVHPSNTIVFPKVGAALLTNKRRLLSKPSLFDNNIMGVKPQKVDPMFLFQYLQRIDFANYAQSGAVPSINKGIVSSILITIPSSQKEQKKIGAILTSVDDAIDKTEQIIEQIAKVKQGVMQQILTKGIKHTKFKKTAIGDLPKNWGFHPLSNYVEINPNYKVDPNTVIPFVEMAAVSATDMNIQYFKERKPKNTSGTKFKSGDTLFARITPCTENGKTALVDTIDTEIGMGSTEFVVLSPNQSFINKTFLYYLMKSERIRNYAINKMIGTTGRQRVPKEVFTQELFIGLPPLKEQTEIVNVLLNLDNRIKTEKNKISKLNKIKYGLAQQLLTGKVRVPVDENEVISQ